MLTEIPPQWHVLLAERGRRRRFRAGERLARQGETAQAMYLIVQGQVSITISHPDVAEPIVLLELGDGEVVGAPAMGDTCPLPATVVAIEDTEALEVDAAALLEAASQLTQPPTNQASVSQPAATCPPAAPAAPAWSGPLRTTNDLIERLLHPTNGASR